MHTYKPHHRKRITSYVGPGGALIVDLLLVESSPPRYFALLVGSRLVVVPLRDTHGRD
jgi:hypothetical protein